MSLESNEIREYLTNNHLGLLATSRKDGSPQQTLIRYVFDGSDIVFTTPPTTAKSKNMRRSPRVSIAVVNGRQGVVLYGEARVQEGAAAERSRELVAASGQRQPSDLAERLVYAITPEKLFANGFD